MKARKITKANHTEKARPLRSMETNTKASGSTVSLKAKASYRTAQKISSTRVSSLMERRMAMELRLGLKPYMKVTSLRAKKKVKARSLISTQEWF